MKHALNPPPKKKARGSSPIYPKQYLGGRTMLKLPQKSQKVPGWANRYKTRSKFAKVPGRPNNYKIETRTEFAKLPGSLAQYTCLCLREPGYMPTMSQRARAVGHLVCW